MTESTTAQKSLLTKYKKKDKDDHSRGISCTRDPCNGFYESATEGVAGATPAYGTKVLHFE